MSDLYSGFIHKRTHEIFMAHPCSHSKTQELLELDVTQLSEWEWKRGADAPEVRTHNDGHSAELRLCNAVIAKFQTRDGIVEPMRAAAKKHGITLVVSRAELDRVTTCRELVVDIAGEIDAPALTKCGLLDARAATSFSAPALTECVSLDARAATSFSAPALTKCVSLDARAATMREGQTAMPRPDDLDC